MRELQPEALRRLSKGQFERFCQRLLEREYEARFEPGAVDVEGAAEEDVGDGGRDLRALVAAPATNRAHWPLLPDQPADVWYSCKTHKEDGRKNDPGGWRAQVRKNVDPTPRLADGRTGELVSDADEIADRRDKPPPPNDLLRALADGGRYVVLVNVRAERRMELERELRNLFEFWIRRIIDADCRLASDAVRVHDASYLARVFNERPFTLAAEIERQLSIAEPSFLLDWGRWTQQYTRDRRDMKWEPDARRRELTDRLHAFLTRDEGANVFRLWGPPGVGKTRLIHHVLGDSGLDDRVRFSEDVREIRGWLTDPANQLAADLILVVDEVTPSDAAPLARDFSAHASATARLIIIGPSELDHEGQPTPETLDRLDDAQTRAILANEMGGKDERLELALGLCRGFPLFAYWLGHALARDPGLLADPGARLTADDDPWDATCAVLAGPRGDDEQRWRERATRRGKALVLASLTSDHAWSRLGEHERSALADALGLSWRELETAANECVNRSLLRIRDGGLRYVSPANLERLVLNHFFSDKGPGGPPLDPGRFFRELDRFFAGLARRAELVHASDRCKRNLAGAVLHELEVAARSGVLARRPELARLLSSAAHMLPQPSVDTIETIIAALGVETVVRGPLLWPLEDSLRHISMRRISSATFERVESALFMLALVQGEVEEVRVRVAWPELFRPLVHLTRQPFEWRFGLLRRRLSSELPREREQAVIALGFASASRSHFTCGYVPGWDDVDGPWEFEQRPAPDYSERFEDVWSALLDVSDDPSDRVSGRAREVIADNLREGLRAGLSARHLERLSERVRGWSVNQRDRLAEQVDDVVRTDLDGLRDREPLARAFLHLRDTVQPSSLEARVIAQVGRWHPGPWPINAKDRQRLERERDAELARQIIGEPRILATLVSWLSSAKAVRSTSFAFALGREDESQTLFPILREYVEDLEGQRLVAAYLAGWGEGVGDERFDDWLDEARSREPAALLARAVTMTPATDHRAALLVELMRGSTVPIEVVSGFGLWRGWTTRVSTDLVDQLVIEVAKDPTDPATREGIGLLETRLQRDPQLTPPTRSAAHDLLTRPTGSLPAIVSRSWTRSLVSLAQSGDLGPVQSAVEHALEPTEIAYPHHLIELFEALAAANLADRVWALLADSLSDEELSDRLRDLIMDAGLLEAVSAELVLEWIAGEPRRAALVAHMTTPAMQPHGVARELISRFGAASEVGRILASKADELAGLDEWLSDPDPQIQRWLAARAAGVRLAGS